MHLGNLSGIIYISDKEAGHGKSKNQQYIHELEIELEKEGAGFSDLLKAVSPLLKRQMKELGRETGKEIKQMSK